MPSRVFFAFLANPPRPGGQVLGFILSVYKTAEADPRVQAMLDPLAISSCVCVCVLPKGHAYHIINHKFPEVAAKKPNPKRFVMHRREQLIFLIFCCSFSVRLCHKKIVKNVCAKFPLKIEAKVRRAASTPTAAAIKKRCARIRTPLLE